MPKIVTGVGPSNALGCDPDAPYAAPGAPEPGSQEPTSVPVPPGGAEGLPEPPPVKAPKAEHVEYVAEVLGVPPEEAEQLRKPELVELARAAVEGGEQPFPGSSSSTSSSSASRSSTPSPTPPAISPAPAAASPSAPAQTATPEPESTSGAGSTATRTPATTSAPNGSED